MDSPHCDNGDLITRLRQARQILLDTAINPALTPKERRQFADAEKRLTAITTALEKRLGQIPICTDCGAPRHWPHDHAPDGSGIDDGPPDDGRKGARPKKCPTAAAAIGARTWTTRRERYGPTGHSRDARGRGPTT